MISIQHAALFYLALYSARNAYNPDFKSKLDKEFQDEVPYVVLPDGIRAVVKKDSYEIPAIFKLLQEKGGITDEMMYNTYNMGLGMIVAVDPADVDKTMEAMKSAGDTPYVVGKIVDGEKGVDLV